MDRSPVPSQAAPGEETAAERRQRIDEEHARLRDLLEALEGNRDLERVDELLGELRALLVEHFETEEGPGGMHEIVGDLAAHRLPNVQHLFDEHRDILVAVDALRARLTGILDGPVRELVRGTGALVGTLRRHEHDEEELFTEAFYTDIGGRA